MLAEMGGEGVELFDCDKAVAELQRNGRLSRDLVAAFGADALDAEGAVNKDYLRSIVQNDAAGRHRLEEITHPKLAQMCLAAQSEARRRNDVHTFLVDIPLYYESPVEFGADKVCVVAASPETQIARMAERNGFTRDEAVAMMAAQMPTILTYRAFETLRISVILCSASLASRERQTIMQIQPAIKPKFSTIGDHNPFISQHLDKQNAPGVYTQGANKM